MWLANNRQCKLPERAQRVAQGACGEMESLGFKRLSVENWMEHEEVMQYFVHFSPEDGQPYTITGESWVSHVVELKLNDTVPAEIRRLFESARGPLAYGYYFYPLYLLGLAETVRLTEAAAIARCQQMGAPAGATAGFQRAVNWLESCNALTDPFDKSYWDSLVEGRNHLSHPERLQLITPGEAIRLTSRVLDAVNALFA